MALVLADRVQETTATTGTGSITLGGAVSGYQSFAVVGNGNSCFYTIVNNSAWEVGIGTYSTTGPSLARTTVLSNSSGNTSPITLSGASSVFLTYPAEQSVNLDASGNVSPLGTVASGTWNGSTVGVAYGGTGVTSSSGASSVVLRDSNANVTFNNFIAGAAAVTAAAGTTVLTAASARTQILVGSTTQTFQLPDATTMALGQSFTFVNNSSAALTVTNNSSATVETIPSGGVTQLGAVSIATSSGTWGAYSFIPAAVNWGTNTLDLATTVISGGTWNGGVVAGNYGGTGLSTFVAANNALYSSGASTLTAGTLPVAAGGTGVTSLTSGYIPYGNGTSGFSSSSSLQFNGTYLVVGGTTPLGGATNPITAFSSTANNFVQTYVYNASTGTSASADFVAYADNGSDSSGFADLGFTSSTYADPTYTVTGPNEAYVFGSARAGAGATGNLVYATDFTGSANAHQWYVGGFTQAKSAWKMQLTSTGLQLANALAVSYGGTGSTTASGARTNLGATTVGGNMFTLANPSAITFPRFNADNTVSALDAASFRTAIGAGTSSATGTVTSIATTGTVSGLTLGGGTITTTGTITLGGTLAVTPSNFSSQTANTFLAAPNGAAGVPTFRAIVAADIPTLNQNTTGSSGSCTGNAATATTAAACSGTAYLATAVQYVPNRTDAAAYPVLWGAAYTSGSGTIAYSCAAVTITSSTGQLNAGILVSAGNVTAYSDERVKTNWRGYSADFVERLANIKHGTYDRTDQELTQDGVSAQSLQTLLPNSVVADGGAKLSVNYGGAAMVSAVQLAKRVVEQDERIAKLEALVVQLLEK